MAKVVLLLVVFVALCSGRRDKKNVTLTGDQWDWVIENFSGFNYWRRNDHWTINTDANSTIKVLCLQMRLPRPTNGVCSNGKLVFNDGLSEKTYCGRSEMVLYQGNSSKVNVDFEIRTGNAAVFWCKGKSVHPPQSYQTITVNQGAKTQFEYPEVLGKDRDQAFVFKSNTGSPITLKCTAHMEPRVKASGLCVQDILTINSGDGSQVYCGNEKVTVTGTEVTMRVETYQATEGHVKCDVEA